MSNLNWLFASSAFKIAPANKPFWYTSGLIGPYYINTHYLCGGENEALAILKMIDEKAEDRKLFPNLITQKLDQVYQKDEIFSELINELALQVNQLIKEEGITYISGGQRRDWFFAPIIASKLNIPCLYIYNDLSVINQKGDPVKDLAGAKVINIADLLTAGSSYTDKWVPALNEINGQLFASANIVDRSQGGSDHLSAVGIKKNLAIFTINQDFFNLALKESYINAEQHQILISYFENQDDSMRNWLIKHPEFLTEAQHSSDPKIKARAKTLIDKDLYRLND